MPSQNGASDADLIARLLEAPQRFRFHQAVSLLLDWLAGQGVPAERALVDCLRFDNSISPGFPGSEIEALSLREGDDGTPRIHLTPTFMGFLGNHGALPNHYSERIAAWQQHARDDAPRAFLDLFSTRVLALFYQAWRKYRIERALADAPSPTTPLSLLLALAGRGGATSEEDAAIAFYAGLLQHRQLPSVLLARIFQGYFGVLCRVEESIVHMDPLAPAEQSVLGERHATLGAGAMLGPRSCRPDLRARLCIGPLDRAAFSRFLPGGRAAAAVQRMLTLLAPPGIGYEIRLILAPGQLDGIRLAPDGASAHLGRDSFLLDGANAAARRDVAYQVTTMPVFPASVQAR